MSCFQWRSHEHKFVFADLCTLPRTVCLVKWSFQIRSNRMTSSARPVIDIKSFSKPLKTSQILSNPVKSFQILSNPLKSSELLTNPFKSGQILSNPLKSYFRRRAPAARGPGCHVILIIISSHVLSFPPLTSLSYIHV